MSRREPLAAAAVYLLLAVVLFGQALLPDRTLSNAQFLYSEPPWTANRPADVRAFGANDELVDPVTQFEPFLRYTDSRLPHAPLWNPYISGGRPFLANAQSAVFSPYSVPSYVIEVRRSLVFVAILKLLAAAFGMWLFARLALGMRFAGALLAGTVFAFSLFMVVWLPWPLSSVWSYLPWMLLLADRLARAPGPLPVAGMSAAVGLQYLGGHPESSFHVLAGTAIFFGFRLVQRLRKEGRAAILRPLGAAVAALALGSALAAAALVPLLELLAHSSDLAQRAGQAASVEPRETLAGIVLSDWFGRPTQTPLTVNFLVGRAYYVGALPLLLAGVALLRPTATRLFFAAVGAVSLAVVVGIQPFAAVVHAIPGFHAAHNTRLTVFYVLALALLAGWALDDLVAKPGLAGKRRRWALAALAAALVLGPIALVAVDGLLKPGLFRHALDVAWGFADQPVRSVPDAVGIIRLASLLVWLPFVLAGIALLAARLRGRVAAVPFAAVAVVLVAADLFRAGMGENPATAAARARQPVTPALARLLEHRPARFVGASTPAAFPIWPNVAMDWKLYDARGYDYPVVKRYSALWKRGVSGAPLLVPSTLLAPIDARTIRTLSLLGVTDVLEAPDGPPLRAPGLRLAYRGPDAKLYANSRAMPRVAVVGAVRVVRDGDAALAAVTAPGFDPRRTAVAERPIAGLAAESPLGLPTVGKARVARYEPERVVIRARTATTALVVLDDVAFPGWQATLDGRRVPIERVDYLLRGVRVGPGAHTVEMRYRPTSWRVGWIVSLAALLALLALSGYGFARHTRTARAR